MGCVGMTVAGTATGTWVLSGVERCDIVLSDGRRPMEGWSVPSGFKLFGLRPLLDSTQTHSRL